MQTSPSLKLFKNRNKLAALRLSYPTGKSQMTPRRFSEDVNLRRLQFAWQAMSILEQCNYCRPISRFPCCIRNLKAKEESHFQDASINYDAFAGWASSSSMFTDFQKLKAGVQLKRDEALARALEDSDDQEQLMIMLSLQERQEAPQIDRNVRQDDVDPDAMSYEELMGLTEALGAQNKGLTPEEIRGLSVKKYKRCCFRSSKEEQCVICQQQYQRGDSIIPLPSCKHTYHKKCIRKWLEIKKMCPICNVEVLVH